MKNVKHVKDSDMLNFKHALPKDLFFSGFK